MAMDDLLSLTGLPADFLQKSLGELMDTGLIENNKDAFALTERGNKARYLVAS